MKVFFFILVTFLLLIVQTVIFPSFRIFTQCFDLLIIEVLFLSLISSHHSVLISVVLIGIIMDSISGAVFFHYIFSYVWIYMIVHLVKQLFFKQSFFFLLLISAVSILIQQSFVLFSIFVKQDMEILSSFNFITALHQLFWGLVFIPLGVWLLQVLLQIWENMTEHLQKKISKNIEWYLD
ncbi:MAG: hypothetical protein KKH99_10355 [Proteobacteria bacterium]|nr:hypothetical protein [Pseudomonadota bacterium]